jgi:hypothetical protein
MQLPALRRAPLRDRPLSRSNATQHKAIGDYGDQQRIVRRAMAGTAKDATATLRSPRRPESSQQH